MNTDLLALGTALAAAIISLATLLPKLLATFKKDKLEGAVASTQHSMVDGIQHTYEKQLATLWERFNKLEDKVATMDLTIHSQAIKVTRLTVVVIQVRGLLEDHDVPIPHHIKVEMDALLEVVPEKE